MNVPERHRFMSVDEYLRMEENSSIRHEFVDGHVFAMSGTTLRHNIIAGNFHSLLKTKLGVGPCRVFISDVKVRIESYNCFYYPDITVSCSPSNIDSHFIENPVLIIEILSHSTAGLDRREKLMSYMKLKSLKEYVIVHQTHKRVEVFEKTARQRFRSPSEFTGGTLLLKSLPEPVELDMDAIYDGVNWKEPGDYSEDSFDWSVQELVGSYTW